MNDLPAIVMPYLVLAAMFAVVALVPLVGVGLTLSRPALLTFAFVCIPICFGQSTYGAVDADRTIYMRGSGQLFFPFVVWMLVGLAAVAPLHAIWSRRIPVPTNLGVPFALLAILFAGHMIASPHEVRFAEVLGKNGFVNLLFLGLVVYVMTRTLNGPEHLAWLERLLLFLGAIRATYGLLRWALLGGDPANFYENREHLDVKLTYFDICDSMVAAVVLVYCLRRLFSEWPTLRPGLRLGLLTLAAMEFAIILLSYRRTSWGGLALALLFFGVLLPSRQKFLAALAAPAFGIALLGIASARLGKFSHGGSLLQAFFYEFEAGSANGRQAFRAMELNATWETISQHPIFGTGAWGRYNGAINIPWQVGPDAFTFVHSGLLHILLKTGILGAVIVASALFLFVRFAIVARKSLAERERWLYDAALAGLVFMIPDFVIGTPIIQLRTMLLYGIFIAIPYLCVAMAERKPIAPTQ